MDANDNQKNPFGIWYYNLIHYDKIPISKKKLPDFKGDHIFTLGTFRYTLIPRFILFFWATLLLGFSSLVVYGMIQNMTPEGGISIIVNDNPTNITWSNLTDYIIPVLVMLLFPSIGLIFLVTAIKHQFSPKKLFLFTEEQLIVFQNRQVKKYNWKDFDAEKSVMVRKGRSKGSVTLASAKSELQIELSDVKDPHYFFQFIDQRITGNFSLRKFNKFKRGERSVKKFKLNNAISELLLKSVLGLQITIGALLFGTIPFLLFSVKPMLNGSDSDMPFHLMLNILASLFVIIFLAIGTYEVYAVIRIELHTKRKGNILKTPSFIQGILIIIYGFAVAIFYIRISFFNYNPSIPIELFFTFFGGIVLFFILLFINHFFLANIKKRINPILVLREFGAKGIAGNWLNIMSNNELAHIPNEVNDSFLIYLKSFLWLKPIFAYHDQRLNEDGLQDDFIHYLEASGFWLDNVTKCAKLASAIIMVPASSESVIEELQMIQKYEMNDKTFILMPPNKKEEYDLESKWNQIKDDLKKVGYELPKYEQGGLLYKPGSKYEIKRAWKLYDRISNIMFISEFNKLTFSEIPILESVYGKL